MGNKKKTASKKKLNVKKESLRKLSQADQEKIAGGLSAYCGTLGFRTWGCPTRPPEGGGVQTYGC